MNIIVNRNSFQVVGVNRAPSSNEFEVVNVADMSKEITVTEQQPKMLDGKELYKLVQPDLEIHTPVLKTIESTNNTGIPVMIKQQTKIPLLDESGKQITYQPMQQGETTEVTEDPVMITVINEDGTTSEFQKIDENNQPLYYGPVPIGNPIACFTTGEIDAQKKDEQGNLLYWEDVTENVVSYESQPEIEITEDDERYTEGLEKVMVDVDVPKTVTLYNNPESFSYEEIETGLETFKKIKIDELNKSCNETILAGFVSDASGVEHRYDFDYEAQINFQGVKDAFRDGLITSVEWGTQDAGPVIHTQEQFNKLWLDGFTFKNTNINTCRKSKESVEAATTLPEIVGIT